VTLDVEIPTPLTVASNIVVLVRRPVCLRAACASSLTVVGGQVLDWNEHASDKFLGRFEIPAAKATRRWPGDPKWHADPLCCVCVCPATADSIYL
jgi:hypothetical protein